VYVLFDKENKYDKINGMYYYMVENVKYVEKTIVHEVV